MTVVIVTIVVFRQMPSFQKKKGGQAMEFIQKLWDLVNMPLVSISLMLAALDYITSRIAK